MMRLPGAGVIAGCGNDRRTLEWSPDAGKIAGRVEPFQNLCSMDSVWETYIPPKRLTWTSRG